MLVFSCSKFRHAVLLHKFWVDKVYFWDTIGRAIVLLSPRSLVKGKYAPNRRNQNQEPYAFYGWINIFCFGAKSGLPSFRVIFFPCPLSRVDGKLDKCTLVSIVFLFQNLYNLMLWWVYVHYITKTRLYDFDPLKPRFYIVKLGFTGVYIIFLISAQKHRLWVLVRTASVRRF